MREMNRIMELYAGKESRLLQVCSGMSGENATCMTQVKQGKRFDSKRNGNVGDVDLCKDKNQPRLHYYPTGTIVKVYTSADGL